MSITGIDIAAVATLVGSIGTAVAGCSRHSFANCSSLRRQHLVGFADHKGEGGIVGGAGFGCDDYYRVVKMEKKNSSNQDCGMLLAVGDAGGSP